MNFKQNPTFYIGLAIPVLMILFVVAAIYLPPLFVAKPQTDFVYLVNENNRFAPEYEYFVSDNKLQRQRQPEYPATTDNLRPAPTQHSTAKFFLHNTKENTNKELSFEEASALSLNSSVKSPDGYEIRRGSRSGGVFPFFYENGDYNAQYLVKGGYSEKMEITRFSQDDYYNFQFLGWIQ